MLPELPDLVREDGVALVRAGKEWKALCPFHKERTPSFSLFDNGEGWRFHCFGCGQDGDEIDWLVNVRKMGTREALRLREGDTGQPEGRTPADQGSVQRQTSTTRADPPQYEWLDAPPDKYVARYVYRNARGKVQFYVQRYEIEGRKVFGQYTRARQTAGGPVRWIKGLPIPRDRPLYGLVDLLAADPARQVMVVEGEKCRDAVMRAFPKTTSTAWVGGTGSWAKTDWTPVRGRPLLLVADGDVVGHRCMFELAAALHPACPEIALVLPPTVPHGQKTLDIDDEIRARPKSVQAWMRRHARAFDPDDVPVFDRNEKNEWVYGIVYEDDQPTPENDPLPAESAVVNNSGHNSDRKTGLAPSRLAVDRLAVNHHFEIVGLRGGELHVLADQGREETLERRELETVAGLYRVYPVAAFWNGVAGGRLTRPLARQIAAAMFKIAENRGRERENGVYRSA